MSVDPHGDALHYICSTSMHTSLWCLEIERVDIFNKFPLKHYCILHSLFRPWLPYNIGSLAEDTIALLDDLGCKKFHLIGISMGGMVRLRQQHDYYIVN